MHHLCFSHLGGFPEIDREVRLFISEFELESNVLRSLKYFY